MTVCDKTAGNGSGMGCRDATAGLRMDTREGWNNYIDGSYPSSAPSENLWLHHLFLLKQSKNEEFVWSNNDNNKNWLPQYPKLTTPSRQTLFV